MASRDTVRGTFERAVAAWNDFFFRPRDPTTLGLMRIMAGVFVLYVHLAYTGDLYEFFGEHAWSDLEYTNDWRQHAPFFKPANDWIDTTQNISVPIDREARRAFIGWMKKLPLDPDRRRESLRLLLEMPQGQGAMKERNDGLALAEQFVIRARTSIAASDAFERATEEDWKPLLDALERPSIDTGGPGPIPSYMRTLPVEARRGIGRSILTFARTFENMHPAAVAAVFQHLASQATVLVSVRKAGEPATEFDRTLVFLTRQEVPGEPVGEAGPYLPNDSEAREYVLNYLDRWSVDPRRTYGQGVYQWSVWYHVTNPYAMMAVHAFFLVAMTLFALGLFTRITSVVAWLGVLSYINRSQQILFGMDTMMNICMFYLVIGPSGAALSLDRWLEKKRAAREIEKARADKRDASQWEAILAGPRPSSLANFVTRMVQIHFCFIYAASGMSKLKGPAWWNHTAIWYTIANPEFSPTVFKPYLWLLSQIASVHWLCQIVMSIGTVYTLFLELAFPFLIWRPTLRPYMLVAAILLHTGIAVFMGLTVFGLFMLCLLMAYIPPETVKRWLELGERRIRSSAAPEPAVVPAKAEKAKIAG